VRWRASVTTSISSSAKLDSNGNHTWSKRLGGDSYESAYGLAVDASSNVLLAGYSTAWRVSAAAIF
jgi:hypothetical protein